MKISLEDQIIEAEKTVRDRVRRYQYLVKKGQLKEDTAQRKIETMRSIQSTLMWLDKNKHWIRPVIAVLHEFPDAKVTATPSPAPAQKQEAAK